MKRLLLGMYFGVRLPVLWIIKVLLVTKPKEKKDVSKILLIRIDRIGDYISSLPVIKNLAVAFPEAKIDMLVSPYLADLARLDSQINNVLIYNGFFRTFKRLGSEGYDIAFDMLFDYTLKTALLAYATAAPVRAGFAWGFRQLFFTHPVSLKDTKGKSMAAVHLELLKVLDIPIRFRVPVIGPLQRPAANRMLLTVHPGGYYPSQRWPRESFVSAIQEIVKRHRVFVKVIAGPSEKAEADYIVAQLDPLSVQAIYPRTSAELVSILAESDLMLCNNSGPMHIAAALGIPTVSTMGPTDPVLWEPQGEKNIVLRKGIACSPCGKARCSHHSCLAAITPEEVVRAVEEAIKLFVKKAE